MIGLLVTTKINETISVALLARLNALSGAAWLIDVPRARVVWTNRAGRELLDPDGTSAPRSGWLERDMPAMRRLTEIHRGGRQDSGANSIQDRAPNNCQGSAKAVSTDCPAREQPQPQLLVFSTPNGTLRQECSISLLPPPAGNLVLVICQDNEDTIGETNAAPPNLIAAHQIPKRKRLYANLQRTGTAHANNNSPPVTAGADAATLQEIARRIRETPVGHEASPYSLEALHAAALDRDAAPVPARAAAAPSVPHRDNTISKTGPKTGAKTGAGSRQPRVVNFRRAARQMAGRSQAAAEWRRRANGNVATVEKQNDKQDQKPRMNQPRDLAAGGDTTGITSSVDADYAAKLAHELRTPISAIQSAADLLAREQFGPIGSKRYKDYAQDIKQSAAHALSVIGAMLDPESLASGKPRIEPVALDMTQLVKTIVSGIKPLARSANLRLVTRLDNTLPAVHADARAVRQIVLNLMTNAINFTPAGGRITVTTGLTSDGSVRVEILDTGPGMSRDAIQAVLNNGGLSRADQKRDFNRQNSPREPALTGSSPAGHGYGLPMVMTLARANGARFELSCHKDGGLAAALLFPAMAMACAR